MTPRFAAASRLAILCLVAGSLTVVPAVSAQDPHGEHYKDKDKSDHDKMKDKGDHEKTKVGPVKPPTTDADKIKSALSAGPNSLSKDATVVDMPTMKVLKQGSNGWTCMADGPSPGVDPMCLDKNGMEWAEAWMNHKDPPKGKMGFGYMLQGGSDASNTDPFATEPHSGDAWVDTGPHVMVLNIGNQFAGYPTTATNTKVPYVMYPNTPYAHLMIPVK